ncbi:MAG: PTS sugar transporter subunit IIA, partial [Glaciecola sp.]
FQASILESLVHREKMGSTGIGGGIAIPHGRIVGLTKVTAVVLITDCAIDFDAIDQQPVDIFFALLVPHEEIEGHLQTLSSVATKLNNIDVVQQIRAAQTPEEVIFALTLDSK